MAMAEFRQQHPQVKLNFQYLARAPLIERLLNRQADLAVTIFPVSHPNLEMEEVGRGRLVCVCPYNHALARRSQLSVADLLPFPLIAYARETPFGAMVEALFGASGEQARAAIEVASPQNACALVQAGAGISLVDEFSARSWAGSQLVVRPMADAPVLKATLIRLRIEPMSRLAQAFVDVLNRIFSREGLVSATSE